MDSAREKTERLLSACIVRELDEETHSIKISLSVNKGTTIIEQWDADLWRKAQEQMREKVAFKARQTLSRRPHNLGDPDAIANELRTVPLDPLLAGDAGEPDWDAIQKNERISEGYDDTPNNLGADQE